MSKDIKALASKDPEDLTYEDLIYMQDRGRLPAGVRPANYTKGEPFVVGDDIVGPNGTESGQASDDGDDPDDENYAKWRKDDLIEECEERGLDTSGNKDALVARLEADDQED